MPVKEIETLAEIENELRSLSRSAADSCRYNERTAVFGKPLFVYLSELADRIEAAWKREHDELVYSFDQTKALRSKAPDPSAYAIEGMKGFEEWNRNKEPSVGNAAAMREALRKITGLFRDIDLTNDTPENEAYAIAAYALSKPPRNCDVGTALEQSKRFMDFCRPGYRPPNCEECKVYPNRMNKFWCQLEWAQMPYAAKEGGEA